MANTKDDNGNDRKAKQAWRKKPRKFAPKSRLGCKTCKIRRIKCDLTQPFCTKCTSTGRKCDGYNSASSPSHGVTGPLPAHCTYDRSNTAVIRTIAQGHSSAVVLRQAGCGQYFGRNLSPFMMFQTIEPIEEQALNFFQTISLQHLNEYHPCDSWRKTLMYFAQTVPAVRHAAIALAISHRYFLEWGPVYVTTACHRLSSRGDILQWDNVHFRHYNKAIRLLLKSHGNDSTEQSAITLLVCYLLTAYDHLAGNHIQAMAHVRGGREVSRNIDRTALSTRYRGDNVAPGFSGVDELVNHVTMQIRRLDMQAVMFLSDWTPTALQGTRYKSSGQPQPPFIPQLPANAFHSIDQAAEHLQVLVAHAMNLHYTQQQTVDFDFTMNQHPSLNHIIIHQLESWVPLFENMLLLQREQQDATSTSIAKRRVLVSLLRFQRLTAWTILVGYSPHKEMGYDKCLTHFRQCVALAHEVSAAHEHYKSFTNSGSSKPTFTPEIGFLPVLYVIAAKCRHPLVRREVLGLLRRHTVREAAWNSVSAARVVGRIIDIEEQGIWDGECGSAGEGADEENAMMVMRGIGVEKRIASLSFVEKMGEDRVARMDVTYQMCGREEHFVDTIVI